MIQTGRSLGRQIVWSMVASTLCGVVVAVFGVYFFYGIVLWWAPDLLSDEDTWLPSGIEWVAFAALAAIGGGLAFMAAVRLARRIVSPLTSVAASARRIAEGDLAARAVRDDRSLGEAALLVEDFNDMAANLERASDAAIRWNALIAHELRTPITILRGRLQGLAEGVFKPEPTLFRSLLTQVEALSRVVEDLRTVSLSDAGHLDVVVREVDLAAELDASIRLLEPALTDAGFSLSLDLAPGRCVVDPTRIGQAVMALVHNALRHATPDKLQVGLSYTGAQAEILVADSGPGLPGTFVSHAFLPFQRHIADGDMGRGSGLGLAVVSAVAQAHGGEATYENRDGGACFKIRFNCSPPPLDGRALER